MSSLNAPTLLLVGCGKMGQALVEGWLAQNVVESCYIVDPHQPETLDERVIWVKDAVHLPNGFRPDMVVLAVKPQMMAQALAGYGFLAKANVPFVSIAAGLTLDWFAGYLGDAPVIRVMPNTPAAVGKGVSALFANAQVTQEMQDCATRLLATVGETVWLKAEGQMDAVTAVSGSGPAYVFYLVEAMAEAGRQAGLSADMAMTLARQTVIGAGALLEGSEGSTAATLRENVTSPGGTTEAALSVLMEDGHSLADLMGLAVEFAVQRAQDLAKQP